MFSKVFRPQSPERAAARLGKAVDRAREEATTAAHAYIGLSEQEDWPEHRPMVELMFYLAHVDYELKALLDRVLNDESNRSIWEKYLALAIHEAIDTLPKMISGAVRHAGTAESPRLSADKLKDVARAYNAAIKPIRSDADFWKALTLVRNSVAAHHLGRGSDGVTPLITWTATTYANSQAGNTTFHSQFVEYGVAVGRAVQDLGENLLNSYDD